MWQLIIKFVIAGTLVVAATEASKRSVVWGAVLVSLPLTSIIALGILWFDTRDAEQVSALSWSILLIVLPSVVLFVALPFLLRAGVPFWPALVAACGVMVAAYAGYVRVLEHFGLGD
ncbi:MAG: hypothetical protein JWN72_2162 [Thermoleophilia bacterium]|nr:hypothetical protein [Thermoleophilia bacterium]